MRLEGKVTREQIQDILDAFALSSTNQAHARYALSFVFHGTQCDARLPCPGIETQRCDQLKLFDLVHQRIPHFDHKRLTQKNLPIIVERALVKKKFDIKKIDLKLIVHFMYAMFSSYKDEEANLAINCPDCTYEGLHLTDDRDTILKDEDLTKKFFL